MQLQTGDSPTIKRYIDKSVIEELARRILAREASLNTILTIEGSMSETKIYDPASSTAVFESLPSPLKPPAVYRVKSLGGESEIAVTGFREDSLNIGYIELILDKAGITVLRIQESRGSRFTGLRIIVADGVSHEVVILYESLRDAVDLSEIKVEQGDSSRLTLTAFFKPGSLMHVVAESRSGKGSALSKTMIIDAASGSRVELEDSSRINTPGSSVESYIKARLGGGSIAALRGKGVVARGAVDSKVVYGIESLITDTESKVYMHPFLEINTNRVAEARHYARNYIITLDKVFYMGTRGLDPGEATMLLIRGFMTMGLSGKAREIIAERIASKGP
ncbi:SufD family Fe-S cluster assembly protein [Desulfurococcus mucosus]|uniref:SufBD protein n=1 Tax=Desulfurococcus mucosus (strain ATCC 35584 / DSM 2162 / JCM 9187 / O7/1) TaxID=765177 RepID=E8R7I6_DESM0|nr:SufD family Fe-S cluster assembly protein [Desulfurococcus mucosus]ADV64481.1 SufBD protein [Desulfurococcus mucosus DSM 2162]